MRTKGRQIETKHGVFLVTEIKGAVEVPLHLPSVILGTRHVGKEMHCRKAHEESYTFRKLRSKAYRIMWTKFTLSTVMRRDAPCETQGISKLLHGTFLAVRFDAFHDWVEQLVTLYLHISLHSALAVDRERDNLPGLKEEDLSIITDPDCKGEAFTERAIPIRC
jgi:hypothetical protein